jgi:DNA-binding CsgD family transcriptional regulator
MWRAGELPEVQVGAIGTDIRPVIRSVRPNRLMLDDRLSTERRGQLRQRFASRLQTSDLSTAIAAGVFAALEKLDLAFVLIRSDSHALFVSASAQRIATRRDCYNIIANRLQLLDQRCQRALEDFLTRPSTDPTSPPALICISSRTCRAVRYVLFAEWLHSLGPQCEPMASLFIYEPKFSALLNPELLIRLYGLTRSEAQLVAKLYAEPVLQTAADSSGISLNTAKTHLKNVFAKCEVRSKAELLRLMALGPRAF